MKIAVILIFFVALAFNAEAQKPLSKRDIFQINCKTVVQIYINGNFSGAGFITDADGLIATANHVISTPQSGFKEYAQNISVLVDGNPSPYATAPAADVTPDDRVNYDSAFLKIEAAHLPHVILGTWDEINITDPLLIVPSWPGM
jgi:S1-C subfamily serine protease